MDRSSRVRATQGHRKFLARKLAFLALAGMAWTAHAPAAEPAWTLDNLEIRPASDIAQFDAGKFLRRSAAPGTTLLEMTGLLRNAQGNATFGPTAYADIQLAAADAPGGTWQESAIAVGTYASGGCQYFPADLPPGASAQLVLKPAGEVHLRRGGAKEPLQVSIRAAEVKVCFAFETSHVQPTAGTLSAAGQRMAFTSKPPVPAPERTSPSWTPWLSACAAVLALVLAAFLLRKRRSKRP